jgi:hypothetical protein
LYKKDRRLGGIGLLSAFLIEMNIHKKEKE